MHKIMKLMLPLILIGMLVTGFACAETLRDYWEQNRNIEDYSDYGYIPVRSIGRETSGNHFGELGDWYRSLFWGEKGDDVVDMISSLVMYHDPDTPDFRVFHEVLMNSDISQVWIDQSNLYKWVDNNGALVAYEEYYLMSALIDYQHGEQQYEFLVRIQDEVDAGQTLDCIVISEGYWPYSDGREPEHGDDPEFGDSMGSMYVVNCLEWVSLRQEMNIASARLAKVPFGAEVQDVVYYTDEFSYCSYNGIQGFILNEYLSYDRQEVSPALDFRTPGEKGNLEKSLESSRFWNMYSDYVPFMGAEYGSGSADWCVGDLLFSADCFPYRVVNCDEYVSLREEAISYSDCILEVPKGDIVYVNGELNGWAVCLYEGRYGWINAAYLKKL